MLQEAQSGPVDQRTSVIAAQEPFDTEKRQRRRRERQARTRDGHARGKDLQRNGVARDRGKDGFDGQPVQVYD